MSITFAHYAHKSWDLRNFKLSKTHLSLLLHNRPIHSKECGLLPGYILSMYHTTFVWRLCSTLTRSLSAMERPIQTLWIIWSFFYLGQVVPSSESDHMRSYRLSKTTIFDAFFQVFLQQRGRNSCFLSWLSNQKHGRGTEVTLTCLFLWHMNMNSVIFCSIGHRACSAHIHLQKGSTNMSGNTAPPSSLIAKSVNDLHFSFGDWTDDSRYQILVS